MTVSLALRGHPSIPPVTRDRIVKLAKRHNYRADPMLSALNEYRISNTAKRFQGTLGWLTCFPTESGWRKMMQVEGYFQGAVERASQLGYQIEEVWMAQPGLTSRRATQILLARGIQGLIVSPLPQGRREVALDWKRFPAVALGYSLKKPQLHVVMNHQTRNMKHTVHHLYGLGYRRIGFAMPAAADERVDHNYLGGYLVAQHELPPDAPHLAPLLVEDFAAECFLDWFREQNPDAVIVSATLIHQVISWLESEGLKVPKNVGLAVASTPFGDGTISGMDEDTVKIGGIAVETVVGMIHRNEQSPPSSPLSILSEGIWLQGKTVREVALRT